MAALSDIGSISEHESVCPLEIWSRAPGIHFWLSSVFFLTKVFCFSTLPHVASRKFWMVTRNSSVYFQPRFGQGLSQDWGTNPGKHTDGEQKCPPCWIWLRRSRWGRGFYRTPGGHMTPKPTWVTFPLCLRRKLSLLPPLRSTKCSPTTSVPRNSSWRGHFPSQPWNNRRFYSPPMCPLHPAWDQAKVLANVS